MKIHKHREAMKWIGRKPSPYTKAEKKKIVEDHYKPKAEPMGIIPYIEKMNRLYGYDPSAEDPHYMDPKEMEDIKKSLPVSEMVKKPKKQIIKKTLIVEKPKPVKPPIIDYLELQDWLNEIDPQWWTDEDSKKEVLLRVPKRKLKGLASILNVG